MFLNICIHRSNGRLFFVCLFPDGTQPKGQGEFACLFYCKITNIIKMCTLRQETLILKQQLLFHSEDIFLTVSNAVFCSCNKIKRRIALQFSAFGKQNRISLIAKSVGTIGHINNYVCLTTYNPLRYKDAKHREASAWKKGRAVRGELREAYEIRGLPRTHTHTVQAWKTKTVWTGMCISRDGRSLSEPREKANLDQNNSASQVFFLFITLEAYFNSTGHNNVVYSQ